MTHGLDPLLIKHQDAWRIIACGKSRYWQLVKQGEIEVVGAGAMSRATYSSIQAYVARLLAKASAEKAA